MKRLTLLVIYFTCFLTLSFGQCFTLRSNSKVCIYMTDTDRPVAHTALCMFESDAQQVLSCSFAKVNTKKKANIILSIDSSLPREGFCIKVSKGKLHISGADAHGLAFGLLEVSRLMGVSPWEYWADCTPRKLDIFSLEEGYTNTQHPAVKYRGIFINDEDWGLNPWATRQEPEAWTIKSGRIKGAIGPNVNEKIFQLMLRLRANYYWPAMHECSQPFFTIEGNREMAARYGIYIGGSHCEPMATSPAAEWEINGEGDYNYVINRDAVKNFWQKRLDDVKEQEIVYTLGMRGVHDGSMQGVKTMEEKAKYLQMVIDDQREMLRNSHPQGTNVPQVFVPYKEVLDIYKSGLKVPDDVTLMWTDDNYGYIRHFPDSTENARSGGNGVYCHVSYWGRPHDYLWLNSLSPALLQQQMLEAYKRGIRQMWILNVGDIKPSEFQIEQFMQLAWDGKEQAHFGLKAFAEREFGKELSDEITNVLSNYFRLSAEMKPEHMAGTRVEESDKTYWNQVHPILGDWTKERIAKRVEEYESLSDKVESLYSIIPPDRKDAFFQLVKYPVQGAAQMNFKYLCPDRCEVAHDSIQSLTYIYNNVCARGKWNGIMDASPRKLPVFAKVTEEMLPEYPDSTIWEALQARKYISVTKDEHGKDEEQTEFSFFTPQGTASVTIRVDLEPNHPAEGNKLAFYLTCDGERTRDIEYQTYDRSEEWKQNVIRGYATRTITIPIDKDKTKHILTFHAAAGGNVQLRTIGNALYIKKQQ